MGAMIPFKKQTDVVLKKPVKSLRLEEAEAIKRACDIIYEKSKHSENDTWIRDRDKLLFTILWTTGARISDVLAMSSEKIDFRERSITFLVKKRKDHSRKDSQFWHTVTLDMETLTEVMDYLQTWSMKGLLFPSHKHAQKPLTRQAISLKLNSLTALVGMKNINVHMYRHGLAMHLQSQGANAETIAFRLAHSSTAVTLNFYARMNASQEKMILEALNIRLR